VILSGDRIGAVEPALEPQPGDTQVDAGWIAPGFIDLQVNGADGVDLTSAADPVDALRKVARMLATRGVTSFCPTMVSSPHETILSRLRAYRARPIDGGATCVGAHVEGPFICPDHRGVHHPDMLRPPSIDEAKRWLEVGPPTLVTLAPELPGALDLIDLLHTGGVLVSLGHSGADAAQTQAGLAAGARMGTHLFNGMPSLHHRRPGLVGALLASSAVLGLIADGVHVDPLVVDLVINRAGASRVALVSDALAAAGMAPGQSWLGEQQVFSDGRAVRRADGTLAGSAMLLDGCLHNLRRWFPGLDPATIVAMATSTPAAVLGLTQLGRVAVGAEANLVVLDRQFEVTLTIIGGKVVRPNQAAE
jgi:N-acetylglucosamine-6-phosphate deacetylase